MQIIEYALLAYFSFSVTYISFFSLIALFMKKERAGGAVLGKKRVAILVPAYREDNIMASVVENLLSQDYPDDKYDVVVIADSFQKTTLQELKKYPIQLLEVSFKNSTKAKSLNYALSQLSDDLYDIVLISDADNLLHTNFLNVINEEYQKGNLYLQGRRVAKNISSPISVLDTANEVINNHIFRKGFNAANLSSSLIGSGMAFPFKNLKHYLAKIDAVGGFDKELQLAIIEDQGNIKYVEKAIAYDEKIESTQAFEHQRRRWVSSHYVYLLKHLPKGLRVLFQGNVSYFNIAVLYNLLLPRMITVGCLFALIAIYLLWSDFLTLSVFHWLTLLGLYIAGLVIPIPTSLYQRLMQSVIILPKVLFIMIRSLFDMKGANKKFLHTTHTKTVVDNDLI